MRYLGDLRSRRLRPSRKHHQAMEDVESTRFAHSVVRDTPPFSLVVPTCIPILLLVDNPMSGYQLSPPVNDHSSHPNRDPHFRCQHHFSSSQTDYLVGSNCSKPISLLVKSQWFTISTHFLLVKFASSPYVDPWRMGVSPRHPWHRVQGQQSSCSLGSSGENP